MATGLTIAGIVVLVLLAGFLTMAQTALDRVGRAKAHHLVQEKRAGAGHLLRIVEDPPGYMNVLWLLMLVSQVAVAVLAAGWAIDRWSGGGELVAAVMVTVLLYVVAVLPPKTLAVQHTEECALLAARPVVWLGRALRPVSRILIMASTFVMLLLPGRRMPDGPFVTEEELRHLLGTEDDEDVEVEERELIHSVFEFNDTIVREVMVPRPDMVVLEAGATLGQALETITEAGFSRIPIYEGDTDNIVGVLYAKDLLKKSSADQSIKAASVARPPLFVPEQKKLADLLREMQQHHVHMAIVVDEYGGTAGLVTIEDLVEEIVGEIVDEYDQEEPLVEPLSDGAIRVDGKMPIDEVNELLGIELPDDDWDTVGGLVYELTGRVPFPGETVRYASTEFQTELVTGRRIQKVVIRRVPVPVEEGAESS
ncbi:MAG: hemolysin family protein [Actinomycetota bacterium]